jgi:eukaryotic-like serine/threonine-protein kinase
MAHYNLGNALSAQKDHPGAAASYRRAVEIDPGHAEAHANLGHALLYQGDFRAALAAYRKADEIGSRRKGWPYPSGQWLKGCQRCIELDGRLPAILKGEGHPADAAERIELASVCRYKGLHAAAVGFVTDAFAADAKLADDLKAGHRYNAACYAALAAAGQGEDAAKLGDKERARLRKQALDWLRADLSAHASHLAGSDPKAADASRKLLLHWKQDADLAAVRDQEALGKLPQSEQTDWRKLWGEVDALLARHKPPR